MGVRDTPQACERVVSGKWSPLLIPRSRATSMILRASFRWFCLVLLLVRIMTRFRDGDQNASIVTMLGPVEKKLQKQIDVSFETLILN